MLVGAGALLPHETWFLTPILSPNCAHSLAGSQRGLHIPGGNRKPAARWRWDAAPRCKGQAEKSPLHTSSLGALALPPRIWGWLESPALGCLRSPAAGCPRAHGWRTPSAVPADYGADPRVPPPPCSFILCGGSRKGVARTFAAKTEAG